jgi:signal transduction histidine kinase
MAYDEIKRKNEELNILNQQKNQFLGMAAHDLRNPLGVIMGYCTLLKSRLERTIDAKSVTMLDKINVSSGFMLGLINDLLDVSVIESGTVALHLDEVNLNELIQENLVFLVSLAEKKNIKLIFNPKSIIPPIVCDPNKIAQVITNLVTNAIKFSRPGGQVEIDLELSGADIVLTVNDHGVGIAPEAQKNLFQPFIPDPKGGTAGEKSTGLGLSIVQKIVNKHNGKIWLDSKVGEGTKFYVSLPRTQLKKHTV